MIALIASIFALGIGPLIYQTFGPMRRTDRIVSGFILAIIAITLFIEVLPQTFSQIGYISLFLALLGFAGPTLIEKLFSKSANKTHMATILLGILGLVIHASIDGAALYDGNTHGHHENLSLAIILHRLPVGLTIWWLLKPLLGERYALLTLLAMAIATTGGFTLSMQLTDYQTNSGFVALQAFISGSLLHIVFHKPHADGCMHTSLVHDHSHAHTSDTDHGESLTNTKASNQFSLIKVIKNKLPDQWELLGILLGILIMVTQHLTF